MTPDDAKLILWRLDRQDRTLEEIREHVAATNGRVSKLELWRARTNGFLAAVGLLGPVVSGVLVYVLTH